MTALADIQDLTMRYGAMHALDHVSLSIPQGSYTVLLGPSGCGKTTLLSILGGFLQPTSGRVSINGTDCTTVPPAQRPTATVFQDYALFPHMTVGDNVGFGLRMRGVDRTARDEKSHAMLETVGLPDAFAKKPHQLSGGQRQRVALARALVVEPQLLLLDEPLGALDLKLRRQMQDELKALQQRVGTAFVHVTHDQEEAMALADHIVVMNNGKIEDQGLPQDVYLRPATAFSASFMGESTIFPAAELAGTGLIKSLTKSNDGLVAIRPEHVSITTASSATLGSATITSVVFQGSFKRLLAQSSTNPKITFVIHTDAAHQAGMGDEVALAAAPEHIVLLRS
jgi:spermidine/putrescine transport system ATP-binding protein